MRTQSASSSKHADVTHLVLPIGQASGSPFAFFDSPVIDEETKVENALARRNAKEHPDGYIVDDKVVPLSALNSYVKVVPALKEFPGFCGPDIRKNLKFFKLSFDSAYPLLSSLSRIAPEFVRIRNKIAHIISDRLGGIEVNADGDFVTRKSVLVGDKDCLIDEVGPSHVLDDEERNILEVLFTGSKNDVRVWKQMFEGLVSSELFVAESMGQNDDDLLRDAQLIQSVLDPERAESIENKMNVDRSESDQKIVNEINTIAKKLKLCQMVSEILGIEFELPHPSETRVSPLTRKSLVKQLMMKDSNGAAEKISPLDSALYLWCNFNGRVLREKVRGVKDIVKKLNTSAAVYKTLYNMVTAVKDQVSDLPKKSPVRATINEIFKVVGDQKVYRNLVANH